MKVITLDKRIKFIKHYIFFKDLVQDGNLADDFEKEAFAISSSYAMVNPLIKNSMDPFAEEIYCGFIRCPNCFTLVNTQSYCCGVSVNG
jgi:hypothetical protein